MQATSRSEALRTGDTTYFTGKPCMNGHVARRKVNNSGCTACASADQKKYRQREDVREARRALKQRWRAENPELRKAQRERRLARSPVLRRQIRWRKRKLPEPTRPEPKSCEACGKAESGRALALDHCHVTGVFRGWLCFKCNTGLGKLGDTAAGLRAALAYLERVDMSTRSMV